MYKLLLCWRYLRTRYIALASIISVTLGVATMIVVNSVMSGFTTEMRNRIHGILSDVIVESRDLDGFPDARWHMEQIRKIAGDSIAGMTATVAVPAMLNFRVGDNWITRQVQLIGIDEATQAQVSDFGQYLQHPANRSGKLSFELRESGYDVHDHQANGQAKPREQLGDAGWPHRRRKAELDAFERSLEKKNGQAPADPFARIAVETGAKDPFARSHTAGDNSFDPARQQNTGAIVGIALGSYRTKEGEDRFLLLPGDDVKMTFPTCGMPPKAISDNFTVVDFYESKMSEYDASFVFVPIRKLQELRGAIDPTTGVAKVNSIQIKLKPGVDGAMIRDKLQAALNLNINRDLYVVSTWQDKQGALLAAVQMETAILNVLLFLIIAVAGFGILAIFLMIVVEKTRDIGVLKSLGASGVGILGIFLSYGLSLGAVGSGVGMVLGLVFVHYINQIADLLGWLTGHPVFDPEIYYFYKIPTIIDPATITWIVLGALVIAVLSSVLPALRAARLHPVEALRYE
jgi:lipoprotein-releasing system permease protein